MKGCSKVLYENNESLKSMNQSEIESMKRRFTNNKGGELNDN